MRASLERLLGGSPVMVVLKLLFLSIVIGAVLTGLGITPSTIPRRLLAAIRSITDLGFDAVRDAGRFLLTGAIVVVPVWLALRVMRGRGS